MTMNYDMEHTTKMEGGLDPNRPMWHEVVRYAPWNYDEYGGYKYCMTEWFQYADVGCIIDGKEFTAKEYLYWERAYVATFIAIAEKAGVSSLLLKHYQGISIKNEIHNGLPLPCKGIRNIRNYLNSLKEGKRIRRDGFELIVTLMLRYKLICYLVSDDESFILETGENYYMLIRTTLPQETMRAIAERYNMFVDPRFAPWLYMYKESKDEYEHVIEIRETTEWEAVYERVSDCGDLEGDHYFSYGHLYTDEQVNEIRREYQSPDSQQASVTEA